MTRPEAMNVEKMERPSAGTRMRLAPLTPGGRVLTRSPAVLASRMSVAFALAFLVACGSIQLLEVQQVDTLYFGTARPGGVVSDAEWKAFVDEVITPRFPGFTEWNATGHWQSEREASHVVEIVHPNRAENDRRLAEIIDTYKSRFQQQAVYWVRGKGLAAAR